VLDGMNSVVNLSVKIPTFAAVILVIGGIVTIMTFFEKSRTGSSAAGRMRMPMRGKSPHRVELEDHPSTEFCHWQQGSESGYEAMLVFFACS